MLLPLPLLLLLSLPSLASSKRSADESASPIAKLLYRKNRGEVETEKTTTEKQPERRKAQRHAGEAKRRCVPLHAEAVGLRLVCCSRLERPPASCQFSRPHYCHSSRCRCYVDIASSRLNCSLGNATAKAFGWRDHQRLLPEEGVSCEEPRLPNGDASVVLKVSAYSEYSSKLRALLKAVAESHRVVALDLAFEGAAELAEDFPQLVHLRSLTLTAKTLSTSGGDDWSLPPGFLIALPRLESLRLRNLSRLHSLLDGQEPGFGATLRRLHVQGSLSLGDADWGRWLHGAENMRQVKIERTGLTDPSNLFRPPSIRLLHLSRNAIVTLDGAAMRSATLRELDLSHNRIRDIQGAVFGQLPSLKQLDLSGNPLEMLPPRAFESLGALEFLNLDDTRLLSIAAGHFLGLHSLTHLSLQGNPQLRLEPFSLLPLNSLETMDLRRCNLTQLPEATTQACGLRRIWFNYNLLHSAESALPPETVLQLIRLSQLSFSENPLLSNPINLLLLPKDNVPLLHSVLSSLKQVPVWWGDQCTAYQWFLHLVKDGSLPEETRSFYRRQFPRNPGEKLSAVARRRCEKKYNDALQRLQPYKGLVVSGRCETVRRLRSLDDRFQAAQTRIKESIEARKASSPQIVREQSADSDPQTLECPSNNPLIVSLFASVLFLAVLISLASVYLCRLACYEK